MVFNSPTLFTYSSGSIFLCVLVYMDVLLITSNNLASFQKLTAYLSTYFHTKDLGPLKYFLGLEVARTKQEIYLCQRKYSLDIYLILVSYEPNHLVFPQNRIINSERLKALCYFILSLIATLWDILFISLLHDHTQLILYMFYLSLCISLIRNTRMPLFEFSVILRALPTNVFFFQWTPTYSPGFLSF